ncbi:hypothetical protein NMY22_g7064 [Coprinellus aureogranulatus]|nr:hypothetical protein NMY22_g7064 [Coprinellus aureogranulatus]
MALSDEESASTDEDYRIRLSPIDSDDSDSSTPNVHGRIELDKAYPDSDSDLSETYDEGYQRRCIVDTPRRKARKPETSRRRARKVAKSCGLDLLGSISEAQPAEGGFNAQDDIGEERGGEGENMSIDIEFPTSPADQPRCAPAASSHDLYTEAVTAGECTFIQVGEGLFVASGWDEKKGRGTTQWYHLQRIKDLDILVCTCPGASRSETNTCCHTNYLRNHGEEHFPEGEKIGYCTYTSSYTSMPRSADAVAIDDEAEAIMFYRFHSGYDDERYTNIFSVPSQTMPTIRNRAIVRFEGFDEGHGSWRCSKDPSASHCSHIHLGKVFMQKAVGAQETEGDEPTVSGCLQYDQSRIRLPRRQSPVSYMPRSLPIWACLSESEQESATRGANARTEEDTVAIPLGEKDACICSREARFDISRASEERPCTIYGTERAWTAQISVQQCHQCHRRMIGPDGHQIGLFNWNNKILVSEHLLDDYTNDFVTRETPFTSFATVMSRKYQSRNSKIPFLHEKLFTEIWFGYITLVRLDLQNGDAACPRCGPTPETTIWDGVTVAFSREHLQPSLEPPTMLTQHSTIRRNVEYVYEQHCLTDKALRKSIRNITEGPSLVKFLMLPNDTISLNVDTHAASVGTPSDASRQNHSQKALLERLSAIPSGIESLRRIDTGVAGMFDRWFGLAALAAHREAPPVYRRFFKQLSAEESILQMVNRPTLIDLTDFNLSPTQVNLSKLIGIPVLYDVARYEFRTSDVRTLHPETQTAFYWIQNRAKAVMDKLLEKNGARLPTQPSYPPTGSVPHNTATPVPFSTGSVQEKSWKLTGCHYTMPQIRHRPTYPWLTHDQRGEASGGRNQKRGVCSKYYSEYSEHRLTGGMMCVWCPHSICYGFHCIPKGEGRNDVFSALYTRWEKAPKRVIYDFACALGPYCLTREPDFFLDTEFRIDSFHAKDHTKCAPATFLATYSATNPELATINTSAGECGNSSLKKIRKSVSYMSQDRAIIYIHVYLAIWNRFRIKALTKDTM